MLRFLFGVKGDLFLGVLHYLVLLWDALLVHVILHVDVMGCDGGGFKGNDSVGRRLDHTMTPAWAAQLHVSNLGV